MKNSSATHQSNRAHLSTQRADSRLRPLSKPWNSFFPAPIALVLASLALLSAQAGNTWDGGGGDDNWGTGNNWNPNGSPAPGSGNDLFFDGSMRLTPINNYTAFDDWRNITFNSGAGSFNITGNAIDLFGKIENLSSNTQTFGLSAIALNSATANEFNPVNGNLTITSAEIFTNGNQLKVFGDNGNTLTFSSGTIIKQGGSVAINQNSTVVYNSAHTYTGDTFVNAGTLQFNVGGSASSSILRLGDTSGTVSATLSVASGANINSSIVVRSGSSGTKTINALNTSGTGTISGSVTLNTGVSASSAGGTGVLDFTGAFTGNSNTLTATGGTVHLSGSGDNVALAATVNSGATLVLNKASTSSVHAIGNSSTINSGGTLRLGGSGGDQIFNSAGLTVNGTFDLNAQSETIDSLNGSSSGAITNNAMGTSTLTIGTSGSSGGGTYSGLLQDGGSGKILALVKMGSGNLSLSGANTYSGGTIYGNPASQSAAGIISFGSSSVGGPGSITSGPLGTGTLTIRNNGVASGSYFQSSDSTTRTISNAIAFGGAGILANFGGTGDLIFDGAVTLGTGTRTFTVNNTNTTFSGAISNSATIAKEGAGKLILSGSNTGYTGTTNVNAGVLNIRNSNALGTTANGTSVAAGASLQLQGVISVGAESLSLTGNTASPYNGTDLTGALRNISDANTYGGAITLASQAAIGADAGSLSLTNTINNAGLRLIVLGAGEISSSNTISGAGDLLKQDAGTLTLTGNNTFGTATNAVFLDKGTIQVGTGGTVGTTNGTSTGWINMGASVAGRNGDSNLLARDAGVTIANPIDSRYYATDVPGAQTVGGLNTTGTTNFTGTLAVHDNVSLTASGGGTVVFSGQIQPGSLSGANNQTAGQSLVGGIGGGVTKIGSGTVILTNANTYAGGTTITGGTLVAGNNSAFGSTGTQTVTFNGGNLASDNDARSLANNLVVNNVAGNQITGSNSVTLTGNASGAGTLQVNLTNSIKSVILGTATTDGFAPGTLDVSSGTLLLGGADKIGNTTALTLSGGTFNTGGFSETLGALTLSANSTIQLTLGDNSQDIRFSDYVRTDGLLTINDWTLTAGTTGTAGRLLFATSANFDSTELSNIQFTGFGPGAQLISFGGGFDELVPVPEPSSVAIAAGLFGLIGWRERRKMRQTRAAERRAFGLTV